MARQVSSSWQTAIAAPVRQITARATLSLGGVNPTMAPPSVTVSLPQARISWPAHLVDGITSTPARYAVAGQALASDPAWGLAPAGGDQQMGVWTAGVTGAGGVLSPPLVVTVTFPADAVVYGVAVAGDPSWGDYAVDWSWVARRAGTAVASGSVPGGTEVRQQVVITPVLADTLEVTISRWSASGVPVRLVEASAVISTEWGPGGMVEARALQELASTSGEMSADEVRVRVRRALVPDQLAALLTQPVQRLSLDVGPDSVGTLIIGSGWTSSVSEREGAIEVVARDVVQLLAGLRHPGLEPTAGMSIGAILSSLLSALPAGAVVIDPALGGIVLPWVALAEGSVRPMVARIVRIAGARVRTRWDGVLVIEPDTAPTAWRVIPPSQIASLARPLDTTGHANVVQVQGAQLALGAVEQLATLTETVPAGTSSWWLSWQDPARDRTVSVTGAATLDAVELDMPTVAKVRVTSPSGGQATIAVSGRRLVRQGGVRDEARDATSVAAHGERVFVLADDLVQTQALAQQLATAELARRVALRPRVTIDWRGDPALELADGIEVEGARYIVERIETQVAGGLSQRVTARWVEDVP